MFVPRDLELTELETCKTLAAVVFNIGNSPVTGRLNVV